MTHRRSRISSEQTDFPSGMTIETWLVVLPCVLRMSDVRHTFAPVVRL